MTSEETTTSTTFTIQYTKEELDKITLDFVIQMSQYIARVNDRIVTTLEEMIEKKEAATIDKRRGYNKK